MHVIVRCRNNSENIEILCTAGWKRLENALDFDLSAKCWGSLQDAKDSLKCGGWTDSAYSSSGFNGRYHYTVKWVDDKEVRKINEAGSY